MNEQLGIRVLFLFLVAWLCVDWLLGLLDWTDCMYIK